jgi:hypothetical protein
MVEVVWEFVVRPGASGRFERAYGPRGEWAQLFQRHGGYRGTALVRDVANPDRYLTIDSWESDAQRKEMLVLAKVEYTRLDRKCAGLTESERELGVFTRVLD